MNFNNRHSVDCISLVTVGFVVLDNVLCLQVQVRCTLPQYVLPRVVLVPVHDYVQFVLSTLVLDHYSGLWVQLHL